MGAVGLVTVAAMVAFVGSQTGAKPSPSGRWTVASSRSEMTDLETVTARLAADAALPGTVGAVTPVLVLRCQEKKFEVYVDTKMVLATRSLNRIRWDDREPIDDYSWSESSDSKALFTSSAQSFLEVALKAKRLRFEFTPFRSGPLVASFSLVGLSNILPRFRKACDLGADTETPALVSYAGLGAR